MGARKNTRGRKAGTDQQVPVTPFVEQGNKVHGTEGPVGGRGRSGAYAASSVIKRGTALQVVASTAEDEKHECACGCGLTPSQRTSLFMPGHDSKVRAMGKAVVEKRIKITELPPIARRYLTEGGMLEG